MLEIGTGTGSLTGMLADRAAEVISVEVDPRMHQLASEELFGRQNVTLLLKDALRNKNHLDPELLALLAERLAARPGAAFKLVANLPYNVATPILGNLLECPTPPATMTVTIQKELAERITASPGTKDYGALSIWIQSQCRTRAGAAAAADGVLAAAQGDFGHPAHRARPTPAGSDWRSGRFFHQFVRTLFMHRRKFLRSVLVAGYKESLGKAGGRRRAGRAGICRAECRAEQLDVAAILRLAQAVRRQLRGRRPADDRAELTSAESGSNPSPSLRMRARSVCGLIPSNWAAPPAPSIRPCVRTKAASMCRAIAWSSVANVPACGGRRRPVSVAGVATAKRHRSQRRGHFQMFAVAQDHRPFDHGPQFAHVARPGIADQQAQILGRGQHGGHAGPLGRPQGKMGRHGGNVFDPLADRRQAQRKDRQAIPQILAKRCRRRPWPANRDGWRRSPARRPSPNARRRRARTCRLARCAAGGPARRASVRRTRRETRCRRRPARTSPCDRRRRR